MLGIFVKSALALFILFSGVSFAQTTPPAPVQPLAPTSLDQTSTTVAGASEVAVLKAQLSVMQNYTDRLLSTVYWALGAVVGLGILLIGYGWFSNARMHERDILSIRAELRATLSADVSNLRSEVLRQTEVALVDVSASVSKEVDEAIQKEVKPLQRTLSSIQSDLKRVKHDCEMGNLESKAHYWELKKVDSNLFPAHISILGLSVAANDRSRIGSTLRKLREIAVRDFYLMPSELTQLTSLLDKLPSEYAIQVEAIRSALRNKTVL